MTLINRTTFIATGTETKSWKDGSADTYEIGTVEVTLRGRTQPVEARKIGDRIVARGLTGRYQQGGKAWPATITSEPSRGEYVWFGRDDRSGRFNKANGLFFA